MGDHQQHQIYDSIAHLDIIRIMRLILNTELQDEVMETRLQMKNAMTRMTMMAMVVAHFAV